MSEMNYVDFFAVLGVEHDAKPGEVRNQYKRRMKDLVAEISNSQLTAEKRNRYLLEMARLNAAFYILRDQHRREKYVQDKARVEELETAWRSVADPAASQHEDLRRRFDRALRDFLSAYYEELILEAGRDPECVEASGWDLHHERHASRVLRHFRQREYHAIQERLPFYEVTQPAVDWDERARAVAALTTGAR